ncbi:MAG: hypothetical protein UZ01_00317 [Candidatus Brocadia sinica]|nr:MAG: hypothetical protein UZ01_00317 [Candidatus Brocadia sinica]MCK6468894.1 hypothetical protein [Candidatus Brocadia sinica]NUO06455.1 hypothetical protein [Candidatus Brocadia sinica]
MEVLFFLQIRTKFIRAFYAEASFPFTERKRKIEAGEDPFKPLYNEGGEPQFLKEWEEADEALDVLGQMCISMLSSSLQLYLKESVNDLHGRYNSERWQRLALAGLRTTRPPSRKGGSMVPGILPRSARYRPDECPVQSPPA